MVVYFDEHIIAVNKKAGISVQPGKSGTESLTELLAAEYGELFVVHRIDTPATGLVLLARTKEAAASLSKQFSTNSVNKRYLAATDEVPGDGGRLIDFIHIPSGKKVNKVYIRTEKSKNTKKSSLVYREIYKTEKYHILEILLETGRRHQIRVQLSGAGAHIKGDVKYGARRTNRGGGIHLHALSLDFTHPADGRKMKLHAQLPDDPVWNSVPAETYSSASKQS